MIDTHLRALQLLLLVSVTSMRVVAQSPTWSTDIACIVYTHCTPCHHDGGAGNFSLAGYDDAFFWRNEMAYATQVRFMPPWPPDPAYRSLAHERVLTQQEIDLIAAWVNDGAPEGDPQLAPPAPVFSGEAVIAQPSLSVVMPDFAIPPSTSDLYRCFVMPSNTTADQFITGLEVLPGNSAMVHHVLVFQDTSGQAQVLDGNDPAPGYTSFGGIGVQSAKLIGIWVPGAEPYFTPQGMGIKLLAGADIVIQVHYPATSNDSEVDSTRVSLQLTTNPATRNLAIDAVLDHLETITNGPLIIPPNEVKTFNAQYTTLFPATITAIGPHSHLLGKQMKSWAVLPGGEEIPLIDIPDWDFHWQGLYSFRNPIYLPTGTTLYGEATYDNTVNNPHNPNSPPEWVWLGESTTNEMMLFYFAWTVGLPGDVNIVVDTSAHAAHYLDCEPAMSVGMTDVDAGTTMSAWPIPARNMLFLRGASSGSELRLIDMSGREVHRERIGGDVHGMDINGISPGSYVLEVRNVNERSVQHIKVVLE